MQMERGIEDKRCEGSEGRERKGEKRKGENEGKKREG